MKTYKVQHNEIVMVVEANNKMEAVEKVVNQLTICGVAADEVKGFTQKISRSRWGNYNVRRLVKSIFPSRYGMQKCYEVWGCEEVEAPVAEEVAEVEAPVVAEEVEFELPKYGTFRTQIWTTGPNGYWAIEEVK
jgi:hypothetical protein